MTVNDAIDLNIEVFIEDGVQDELDNAARQLLSELRETDVESAALAEGGSAPSGTKAVDPVAIGSIAVTVLPTVLPKLVEFVQAWAMRGQGRTVKFKGKVYGQMVEFEGSAEDLEKILTKLEKKEAKK